MNDYDSYKQLKKKKKTAFLLHCLMLLGIVFLWSVYFTSYSTEVDSPLTILFLLSFVGAFTFTLAATDLYSFNNNANRPLVLEVQKGTAIFIDGNDHRLMSLNFDQAIYDLTKEFQVNLLEISHQTKTSANHKRVVKLKLDMDINFQQEQVLLNALKKICYVFKY